MSSLVHTLLLLCCLLLVTFVVFHGLEDTGLVSLQKINLILGRGEVVNPIAPPDFIPPRFSWLSLLNHSIPSSTHNAHIPTLQCYVNLCGYLTKVIFSTA